MKLLRTSHYSRFIHSLIVLIYYISRNQQGHELYFILNDQTDQTRFLNQCLKPCKVVSSVDRDRISYPIVYETRFLIRKQEERDAGFISMYMGKHTSRNSGCSAL